MRLVDALHPEQLPALSGFKPAERLPGFEYEDPSPAWAISPEELARIDAARRQRVH